MSNNSPTITRTTTNTTSTTSTISKSILSVVCRYTPTELKFDNDTGEPMLDASTIRNDGYDEFNHPRLRRAMILNELQHQQQDANNNTVDIKFGIPSLAATAIDVYKKVHSKGMIDFLSTAWDRWEELGDTGQDPMCTIDTETEKRSPPLIPGNMPLHRVKQQRPSRNVMGQVGFFCTDTCTPIFAQLLEELGWDAAVIQQSVAIALQQQQQQKKIVYALTTHPGHHAAHDCFGGYCYVNNAALTAKLLQESGLDKVAILDLDYHCGNGTASIFYEDATVFCSSIHCHPDFEYPFHSGFADEIGSCQGLDTTLHVPLPVGTAWSLYKTALTTTLETLVSFDAQALIVSLGLDTLKGDPCAIRRAGFQLNGHDYHEMGQTIATLYYENQKGPIIVVQEGGYYMEKVPQATSDFLLGLCASTTTE